MSDKQGDILRESIELERNMAELYSLFAELFPEDRNFWWKLSLEEQNHAALLRSMDDIFAPRGLMPSGLLCASLEELRQSNARILEAINVYRQKTPDRHEAFCLAMDLEQQAGEVEYQGLMESEADDQAVKLVKTLNREDRDHKIRIEEYMNGVKSLANT